MLCNVPKRQGVRNQITHALPLVDHRYSSKLWTGSHHVRFYFELLKVLDKFTR